MVTAEFGMIGNGGVDRMYRSGEIMMTDLTTGFSDFENTARLHWELAFSDDFCL